MTTQTAPRPEAKTPRPIPVRLTVNGEASDVLVPPRTQLAEILRDRLNLTATHLACEQGVCGACTVMVNGKPVRSCLTFAADCDGATVDTLEGWQGDELMDRLRAAFTRNHALQCGFCTPGMLATARDLAERLPDADEARIRNELSGNLCRCTGYVGIVAAISEVIAERDAAGVPARTIPPVEPAKPAGFTPFEPKPEAAPAAPAAPTGSASVEDGWTVVRRQVTLNHPAAAVWDHFSDLRAVARCLPGAEIAETDGQHFAGAVAVRFGPIAARFEGEGALSFQVTEATPDTSAVDVSFRFRIEGMLGQFNRPELVNGLVDYILGEFVANCDAVLSGGEVRESKGVSAWAVMLAVVKGWFRKG